MMDLSDSISKRMNVQDIEEKKEVKKQHFY